MRGEASGSGTDYGGYFSGGSAWAEIAIEKSDGDTSGAYFDGGGAFAYVAHDHGTDDTYGGYFDGNVSTNDYAYVGFRYSGTDYKIIGGGGPINSDLNKTQILRWVEILVKWAAMVLSASPSHLILIPSLIRVM